MAALTVGGKRITRSSKSEEEVKLKMEQLRKELQLRGGHMAPSSTSVVTVSSWITQLIPANAAPITRSTRLHLLKHLEPHMGHRPIDQLTPTEVLYWLSQSTKLGDCTRQMAFDLLNRSLRAAVGKLIHKNPCDGIPRPSYTRKPIRPFTAEDVQRILQASQDHRLHAAFQLVFLAGMRQEEVFGAEWEAIDWQAGILLVRQTATRTATGQVRLTESTKTTGSVREVPLAPQVQRALLRRSIIAKEEGLIDCPLICPSHRGTPVSTSNFAYKVYKPILAQLGITPRGLHCGRHAAATLLLRSGVAMHIVEKILGHAPGTTSKVYAHVLPGDTSAALDALANALRPQK